MALSDIDTNLVTVGQPAEGGCCYVCFDDAPVYPTDATKALDECWKSLGELSENGYTEGGSLSSTDHKGWHGSVLLTTVDSETNTYKVEFVEVIRGEVAKLRYGAANVTLDEDGAVSKITGVPGRKKPVALVFEELMSNGTKRRTVVKKAMVTSFDDIPHKSNTLMVYGMTFTAMEVEGTPFDIFYAKAA